MSGENGNGNKQQPLNQVELATEELAASVRAMSALLDLRNERMAQWARTKSAVDLKRFTEVDRDYTAAVRRCCELREILAGKTVSFHETQHMAARAAKQ